MATAVEMREPDPSLGEPSWLALPVGEVLVWLHEPPARVRRGTGVVFCPPFGWDEEKSYRGRRAWADLLAHAGFPTVRFDLPGTGDSSGSPRDPARLDAWTQTVAALTQWLVGRTRCTRVTGLGIGLGGMLAWRAAAGGAAIDDLILWGVPDSGHRLVREIRAAANLIAAARIDYVRDLDGGDLEAVGYRISAETLRDLDALRLSELAFSDPARRRVLLLSPGALHVDRPLREHLEATGVELTVADGPGFAELMLDPEKSQLPVTTIERTIEWLATPPSGEAAAPPPQTADGSEVERDAIELSVGGTRIRERLLRVETPGGRLFGVIAEPAESGPSDSDASAASVLPGLSGVILNAGAVRHTGQNRNGVELARRWAALGLPTARIDLSGLGDSDGDTTRWSEIASMYSTERVVETALLIDRLGQAELPGQAVVVGLCAGAYLAMYASLACERAATPIMINQFMVAWDPGLLDQAVTRTALQSLGGRSWRRVRSGDVSLGDIRRQLAKLRLDRVLSSAWRGAERRQQRAARRVFGQLAARGVRGLMLFGEHEQLLELLRGDGRSRLRSGGGAGIEIDVVPGADHTFRTIDSQNLLRARLERAVLELAPPSTGAPATADH